MVATREARHPPNVNSRAARGGIEDRGPPRASRVAGWSVCYTRQPPSTDGQGKGGPADRRSAATQGPKGIHGQAQSAGPLSGASRLRDDDKVYKIPALCTKGSQYTRI